MICLSIINIYILFANDYGKNMILAVLSLAVLIFIELPIVMTENGLVWWVIKVFALLTTFIILTCINMVFTYVLQTRGRMYQLTVENLHLMDRMHEGLIVLTENDRRISFASMPAVRLLQQKANLSNIDTTEGINECLASDPLTQRDLLKPIFQPTVVSLIENGSHKNMQVHKIETEDTDISLSLESIIIG